MGAAERMSYPTLLKKPQIVQQLLIALLTRKKEFKQLLITLLMIQKMNKKSPSYQMIV